MTTALLATIPLQLVCQLIVPETQRPNEPNFEINQSTLPEGYVVPVGAKVAQLSSLSLELVCKLLVTNNPGVTENGLLVEGRDAATTPSMEITPINVQAEESTTQTPNAVLPEGYVNFPEDHAAYKIYNELVTWDVAREKCISKGARLAIADSRNKIRHIDSLRVGIATENWIHVGIYQSNTTNVWVRVDNDVPVAPIEWSAFDPEISPGCTAITLGENKLASVVCRFFESVYACEIPT